MEEFEEVFRNFNSGDSNEFDIKLDDESFHIPDETWDDEKDETFKTLTITELEQMMKQDIDDVKSIVSMPESDVRILLNSMKWNKNELVNLLTDENRPFANDDDDDAALLQDQKRQKFECAICFKDLNQKDSVDLGCGHGLCTDCCRSYLTTKIMDENATETIHCPVENCGKIVDSDFIMRVLTDANARQKFQRLMVNSFVQNNYLLHWCTAPECERAILANRISNKHNCICTCGQQFCFDCGDECHDPLPCDLMSKWKKENYSATASYLANVKRCPRCTVPIEKIDSTYQGSTYIKCSCEHAFCWNCCDEWDHAENHLNCLLGVERPNNGERCNLLKRYTMNKISLEFEKSLMDCDTIENQYQQLVNKSVAFCNSQFLTEAVEILCESRKQLMFSCIFAYFVKPHDQKEIFEENQNFLQKVTEKLSEYVEHMYKAADDETDIIQKVKNQANNCKRLQNLLKNHIYEGSEKNWWSFDY